MTTSQTGINIDPFRPDVSVADFRQLVYELRYTEKDFSPARAAKLVKIEQTLLRSAAARNGIKNFDQCALAYLGLQHYQRPYWYESKARAQPNVSGNRSAKSFITREKVVAGSYGVHPTLSFPANGAGMIISTDPKILDRTIVRPFTQDARDADLSAAGNPLPLLPPGTYSFEKGNAVFALHRRLKRSGPAVGRQWTEFLIYLYSAAQGREKGGVKFESVDVDWAWIDEKLDNESAQGVMARLVDRNGYLFWTFTPIDNARGELYALCHDQVELAAGNTKVFSWAIHQNKKISEEGKQRFLRRYAHDPEVLAAREKGVWMAAGSRCAFDGKALEMRRTWIKANNPQPVASYNVEYDAFAHKFRHIDGGHEMLYWRRREPGDFYLITADLSAARKGRDRTGIRIGSIIKGHLCGLYQGMLDPNIVHRYLAALGRYWHGDTIPADKTVAATWKPRPDLLAMISVERDKLGIMVLRSLANLYNESDFTAYENIYLAQKYKGSDIDISDEYGWQPTAENKYFGIQRVNALLNDESAEMPDDRELDEMSTMVKKPGIRHMIYEAEQGCHDDLADCAIQHEAIRHEILPHFAWLKQERERPMPVNSAAFDRDVDLGEDGSGIPLYAERR